MTTLPQEGISPDEMKGADMSTPQTPASPSLEEVFGEVIDAYTDIDAIEDGILVDLTQFMDVRFHARPINRMTRHLFDDFKSMLDNAEGDAKKFGYRLKWIFRTKMSFAEESPGNAGIAGDIVTIPPNLWLVRNEVGGWTAMYPEDY